MHNYSFGDDTLQKCIKHNILQTLLDPCRKCVEEMRAQKGLSEKERVALPAKPLAQEA